MDERLQAGIAAARAGKTAQAADLLDQMVRDDPDNVLALVWLAAITPDVDEAVRLLERAVTLDPDNARAPSRVDVGVPATGRVFSNTHTRGHVAARHRARVGGESRTDICRAHH